MRLKTLKGLVSARPFSFEGLTLARGGTVAWHYYSAYTGIGNSNRVGSAPDELPQRCSTRNREEVCADTSLHSCLV